MPRLLRLPVPDDAPVRGPATAPVTVQAFLDLQCPFSARAMTGAIGRAGGFAQAVLAHPDDVRVVFRHNPISFHLGAEPAAEAALEARAEKGDDGFWQVVNTIYGAQQTFFNKDGLDLSKIDALSTVAGLDVGKVRSAISDHRYQARIAADQKLAHDNGLSGTPTFIVGDEIVVGAQSEDVFVAAIARQKALTAPHP
jgi:protein-disulfide isomerase